MRMIRPNAFQAKKMLIPDTSQILEALPENEWKYAPCGIHRAQVVLQTWVKYPAKLWLAC